MTDTIEKLVYPDTKDKLLSELKKVEGLISIEDKENVIEVIDDYNDEHREIIFRDKNKIPYEDLFNHHDNINKNEMILFLKSLPDVLLMNIKKIYFVNSKEDVIELSDEDKSPNHTFRLDDHIGMFVYFDNTVIINLDLIEKEVRKMEKEEIDIVGYFNYGYQIQLSVSQTLTHELYHSLQFNPLFEEFIQLGEDVAESCCQNINIVNNIVKVV